MLNFLVEIFTIIFACDLLHKLFKIGGVLVFVYCVNWVGLKVILCHRMPIYIYIYKS